MSRVTKRYRAATATAGYEKHKRYALGDALGLLEQFPKAAFDEKISGLRRTVAASSKRETHQTFEIGE